jgi:ankyrin repeat protein
MPILLHIAVQSRHVEVVEVLLRGGADPNRADRRGNGPLWTAVYHACRRDRTDANLTLLALLLRNGADAHHKNNAGRSPLDFGTLSGDQPVKTLFAGRMPGT